MTKKHYSTRNGKRNRRGATTVEFAFAVPIIFVMFFGAVEVTRLNFIRQSANNACYEGARKAIVPGGSASAAQTEALNLLNSLGCGRGATATVTTTPSNVTISVSIPTSQNSWGVTWFLPNANVTQTITLSKETLN